MNADQTLMNMPPIGFGTYLIPNEEAQKTINTALKIGYRHIDTAEVYRNEVGIGLGLKDTFSQLSLKRDEVFITSKVFPGNPSWGREPKNYKMCIEACDSSLERLNLDYLDCYLIHAPFCKDLRLEQWKALCDLKKEGKTRTIGVSNYSQLHIQEIINEGLEVPEYNQIELHPWCQKEELVSFLKEKKINYKVETSINNYKINSLANELINIFDNSIKEVKYKLENLEISLNHLDINKIFSKGFFLK